MQYLIQKIYKTKLIFPVLIVAFSSFFRLTNLDLIEFKTDEALNLLLASRPLFNQEILPSGIATSIGILNPPLFIYMLIPFILISSHPQTVTLFISISNVIAIIFLYFVLKKRFGEIFAFMSTALLALSPWSILFSRKIWPPDLVLPFLVILLYSVNKIMLEKKSRFWGLLIAILILIPQLDLAYSVFSIFFLFFLFLSKPKFNTKAIILGIIIGIIPLIPFFIYEIRNACPDCQMLLNMTDKLSSGSRIDILKRPLQILGVGNFRAVLGNDTLTFGNIFPLLYNARTFLYLEYILLPIGMVIFWIRFKNFRFIIYTVVTTISVYSLINIKASIHYFVIFIPFLFIFLASAFNETYKSSHNVIRYLSLMIFTGLIVASFLFNLGFFLLLAERGEFEGDFGRSLKSTYQDVHEDFSAYKNHKQHYQIILSKYVPNSVMRGESSFARLLYPPEITEEKLNYLDYQLKNNATDPRITHSLTTYYTLNPTADLVRNLYLKTKSIPAYLPIYREAIIVYENTNLKKVYFGSMLPFMFEYPKHWEHIEDGDKNNVTVSDGSSTLTIKIRRQTEPLAYKGKNYYGSQTTYVLDQNIQRLDCYNQSNYCGTLYEPIIMANYFYYIEYFLKQDYSQDQTEFVIDTMNSIVKSFTIK